MGPLYTDYYFGGVATVVEELACALLREKHNVCLVTNNYMREQYKGLPVYAPARKPGWIRGVNIISIPKLWWFLARNQFDVVITNLYYSVFLRGVNSPAKTVHIIHGFRGYYPGPRGVIRASIVNYENILGAKYADVTVANSYFTKALYKAMFGVDSFVVPWGVSVPKSVSTNIERNREILYVGRIEHRKQIGLLIDAFKLVSLPGEKPSLRIVGDGPELKTLQHKVEKLGLQDRVFFEGRVDREDVYEFYYQAHCFISLRSAEPFGLTYLESLACGCPVILLKSTGFSHFLEKNMGITVEQETAEQVANAIQTCFNVAWDREQIAEFVLTNYSWDRTAREIIKLVG